jgi:hypothetical protein
MEDLETVLPLKYSRPGKKPYILCGYIRKTKNHEKFWKLNNGRDINDIRATKGNGLGKS